MVGIGLALRLGPLGALLGAPRIEAHAARAERQPKLRAADSRRLSTAGTSMPRPSNSFSRVRTSGGFPGAAERPPSARRSRTRGSIGHYRR
ncbi:MAG: hypothetical protein MZV70_10570 [Desulfobacterales bacterium]|nr:hypothetical protein [Desulfobacterales bacterium]